MWLKIDSGISLDLDRVESVRTEYGYMPTEPPCVVLSLVSGQSYAVRFPRIASDPIAPTDNNPRVERMHAFYEKVTKYLSERNDRVTPSLVTVDQFMKLNLLGEDDIIKIGDRVHVTSRRLMYTSGRTGTVKYTLEEGNPLKTSYYFVVLDGDTEPFCFSVEELVKVP